MKITRLLGVVAVLVFGGTGATPRVAAAGPIACEALGQVPLANATLISAEPVQAGGFTPPGPANASAQYRLDICTTDNSQPQNGVRRIRFIVETSARRFSPRNASQYQAQLIQTYASIYTDGE